MTDFIEGELSLVFGKIGSQCYIYFSEYQGIRVYSLLIFVEDVEVRMGLFFQYFWFFRGQVKYRSGDRDSFQVKESSFGRQELGRFVLKLQEEGDVGGVKGFELLF